VDTLQLLLNGFVTAMQPVNLVFALLGCLLGTLVGVLPGIGASGAMAILIPFTFVLDPTPAIIMLAAIYYGAMYGGTITSVLINTPGEAAAAVTCLDGYEMAKRGRAGAALAISAVGSFIGGTVSMLGLVLLALPLTALALQFGPPEFFGLMVLGLSLVISLAGKSLLRALLSAALGMVIAMVGMDPMMGLARFTFGNPELLDGLGLVPIVMGLFGVAEILLNAETGVAQVFDTRMSTLIPSMKDLRASAWPIARGSVTGFFLGLIPGVGAIVTTFVSYVVEKRMSRTPEKFGTGMIEGVAGPETANNAHHVAALIPLFTLGIPCSASIAIIMGAFMMNGLIPGPLLFKEHADFVWAVIASMYVANAMLLVLNLPLIPMWVAVLRLPYSVLFAIILAFCVLGAYSLENRIFDVGTMVAFGIVGYVFKKMDYPLGPMVLTLILGRMMETGLRRSLEMSLGEFDILFTRPISATLLALAALVFAASLFRLWSAASDRAKERLTS